MRAAPGAGMEALVGGTVIDVVTGRSVPNAVILVRDGRVVAVGAATDLSVPRGATTVDVTGDWIIPGLIDAHAHLQPWGLGAELKWGVTTVRDLHDGLALADTLRAIAARAPAPRLFLAGAMLDVPPTTYPDALPVPSPDSAEGQVARIAASGAAWVKVYTRVTPDILGAVVDAARTHQLPVAAHLGLTDAITAAQLGVMSIEHLSGVPESAGDSTALFEAHRHPACSRDGPRSRRAGPHSTPSGSAMWRWRSWQVTSSSCRRSDCTKRFPAWMIRRYTGQPTLQPCRIPRAATGTCPA